MSPENQAAFEPLQQALQGIELTEADVYEYIGLMAGDMPQLGGALALHVRDILREEPDQHTYSELLAQGLRRALFDPEHAAKYHDAGLSHNPAMLRSFAGHLCASLVTEVATSEFGGLTPMTSGRMQ